MTGADRSVPASARGRYRTHPRAFVGPRPTLRGNLGHGEWSIRKRPRPAQARGATQIPAGESTPAGGFDGRLRTQLGSQPAHSTQVALIMRDSERVTSGI